MFSRGLLVRNILKVEPHLGVCRIAVANFSNTSKFPIKQKRKFYGVRDPRLPKPDAPPTEMPLDIDEFIRNIDTTLTPEQQARVDKIKQSFAGPKAKRSLYRDVATPNEMAKLEYDGFPAKTTENAQKLIDYALSFLPEKAGPRRSRHKKRMEKRMQQMRGDHKRRKIQTKAAIAKKREKFLKQAALVKQYKLQAGIHVPEKFFEPKFKTWKERREAEAAQKAAQKAS